MKIYHITRAFSLIEMMVSFIALCILLTALVPVVTKRIKPSIHVAASSSSSSSSSSGPTPNCSEKFSSDCLFCDGEKRCLVCKKTCLSGTYKDSSKCDCTSCSSIDPNCTTCSDDGICNSCTDNYLLQDNTCTSCPDGFYCTGGTEHQCPEGYYCKNGSIAPCEDGKWSNLGSSSCTLACPEDYICSNGMITPDFCSIGQYKASDGYCTPCEEGFYCPDGKVRFSCNSKTENCATCDSITGDCSGCPAYYDWDGTKCVFICSSNCLECLSSTECTKCNADSVACGGYCLKCPNNFIKGSCNDSNPSNINAECYRKGTRDGQVKRMPGGASEYYCSYSVGYVAVVYLSGRISYKSNTQSRRASCNKSNVSCPSKNYGSSCTVRIQ